MWERVRKVYKVALRKERERIGARFIFCVKTLERVNHAARVDEGTRVPLATRIAEVNPVGRRARLARSCER